MTDEDLAASLAAEAGALLVDLRAASGLHGRALGDAGDSRANELILAALAKYRPDDAVLSEESAEAPAAIDARLRAERVWIVDPLDGTREYRAGRDDWAVHVALSIGGRAAVGAVAIPARHVVLRSDRPEQLKPEAEPLRIATSRSRPAPVAAFLAGGIGASILEIGSAGAKTAAVILGEADAYLHSGAQSEWDNCAPVAVAQAAGLHCSRLDGSPLRYNRRDVVVPDILICHPERAGDMIGLAAEYRARQDDDSGGHR